MFYWKLFKNKYFWLIIVLISISTGIYSYIHDKKKQELIDNAPTMYCYEYRDSVKVPSILVIVDLDYAEEYVAYFAGDREKQNFRSYGITNGSKVKVIDKKYNGRLIKAVLIDKVAKRRIYEEFWIWNEFVKEQKSPAQ